MALTRYPGRLIAIEGSDGSGKGTQSKRLLRWLRSEGIAAERIAFPGYHRSFFGRMVGEYLRGDSGVAEGLNPRMASVLYAGDRWEARERILGWLADGRVVICDRYVDSNKAHQAARLPRGADVGAFFKWIDRLEHGLFRMPRPDLTVFLHVPAVWAERLIDRKAERAYLQGRRRDRHEADPQHLRKAEAMYRRLARARRRGRTVAIECVEEGMLLSCAEIGARITGAARLLLRQRGR